MVVQLLGLKNTSAGNPQAGGIEKYDCAECKNARVEAIGKTVSATNWPALYPSGAQSDAAYDHSRTFAVFDFFVQQTVIAGFSWLRQFCADGATDDTHRLSLI